MAPPGGARTATAKPAASATARSTPPAPPATTRPAASAPTVAAAPIDAAKAAEAERNAIAEAEAADRLDSGRMKMQKNLLDQALADFRQILRDHPNATAAPEAAFLITEVLEKQNKLEDAMAAHLDFGRRFPSNARMAASQLRLGELTERSRLPNRENSARDLYAIVIRDYPRTPQAYRALQLKLRLDRERRPREMDPVLNIQVPAVVPTLRALTEQFPNATATQQAFVQLAEAYENLQQYERAAQTFAGLATNFPASAGEGWFRAGEIYERRLKDLARAREAYGRVPDGSPRYRDAQRKLREK
jgi:TolA-binding protein